MDPMPSGGGIPRSGSRGDWQVARRPERLNEGRPSGRPYRKRIRWDGHGISPGGVRSLYVLLTPESRSAANLGAWRDGLTRRRGGVREQVASPARLVIAG